MVKACGGRTPWSVAGRVLMVSALFVVVACGSTVQGLYDGREGLALESGGLGPDAAGAQQEVGGRRAGESSSEAAGRAGTPGTTTSDSGAVAGPAAAGARAGEARSGKQSSGSSRGRGYDARRIFVGVPTMKDFDQFASTFGVNGLSTGDQEGNAKAMVAYLNKRGGVLGRKLVPVFRDTKTAEFFRDPAAASQAICEDFTRDRPVAAVVDLMFSDGPQLWECWKKAGIPFFSGLFNMTDQAELDGYRPYRHALANNRIDSYFPALLNRQKALGYFKSWDTANGRPGQVPVKVGMMYAADVPADKRGFDRLAKQLRARGIDVAPPIGTTGNDPSQISGAVVQFKSQGVTHVYMTYFGQALTFMNAAENQRYRPRYAAWGYISPGVLEQFAPAVQLKGAVGAGFRPNTDVSPRQNPGDHNSAGPLCRGIMSKAGLRYERHGTAEGVAFTHCDSFRLLADAMNKAGSPAGNQVRQGVEVIGPKFESASVLRNAFSGTRSDASGGVRDLGYVESCSCFRYLSEKIHPS